jgi:hypothetical protein
MNAIDMNETPLPTIARIETRPGLSVSVTWADGARAGRTDEVDLSPVINSYKIFRPLRQNAALFNSAHLLEDGYVIAWDGDDLEMTADMVSQLAEQTMTPADFAEFLRVHQLTQAQAAAMLGRSRRQIGYYLKAGPIPRIVALACKGYAAERAETLKQRAAMSRS